MVSDVGAKILEILDVHSYNSVKGLNPRVIYTIVTLIIIIIIIIFKEGAQLALADLSGALIN